MWTCRMPSVERVESIQSPLTVGKAVLQCKTLHLFQHNDESEVSDPRRQKDADKLQSKESLIFNFKARSQKFEKLTYFTFFHAVCCNHQACISCAHVQPQHLVSPTHPPSLPLTAHTCTYTQQTNTLWHPVLSNHDNFVILLVLTPDYILPFFLYLIHHV